MPERANHRFGCPAPLAKRISFSPDPNQIYIHCRPVPREGRIAIVTDVGRDAVDAAASGVRRDRTGGLHARERSPSALTNDAARGRRSRVVLTPRRRRQVCGRQVGPTGCGRASYPQMTVTRKPSTGESAKQAVKTIACGNAGCSGGPVVTTRVLSTFAHEAAGAAGTPAFPTPSLGRKLLAKPRVHRAAGANARLKGRIRREEWLSK